MLFASLLSAVLAQAPSDIPTAPDRPEDPVQLPVPEERTRTIYQKVQEVVLRREIRLVCIRGRLYRQVVLVPVTVTKNVPRTETYNVVRANAVPGIAGRSDAGRVGPVRLELGGPRAGGAIAERVLDQLNRAFPSPGFDLQPSARPNVVDLRSRTSVNNVLVQIRVEIDAVEPRVVQVTAWALHTLDPARSAPLAGQFASDAQSAVTAQ